MSLMWQHVQRVAEYCDGRLPPAEADRATEHLTTCERCRAAVDDVRFAAGLLRQLSVASPPDALWLSIEKAAWAPPRPVASGFSRTARSIPRALRVAATVVLAVALAGGAYWYSRTSTEDSIPWQLARVEGGVDGRGQAVAAGSVRPGDAVETDAASRLRLTVGTIGTVDISPNTRLRLLATRPAEQRLHLERGEITATINAPPRLFFVNTASSIVVDLGCQYTMRADEEGFGRLTVTQGWASLEWNGRESLVPAGASAETRPDVGPGMPSFDDAPQALKEAAMSFDFGNGAAPAPGVIDLILGSARVRDTLTLWHLLRRVDAGDRERVFDRIVALTPLPNGVTKVKALQLDRDTLERWRQELAWTW